MQSKDREGRENADSQPVRARLHRLRRRERYSQSSFRLVRMNQAATELDHTGSP
jgi:hypothetical protein